MNKATQFIFVILAALQISRSLVTSRRLRGSSPPGANEKSRGELFATVAHSCRRGRDRGHASALVYTGLLARFSLPLLGRRYLI